MTRTGGGGMPIFWQTLLLVLASLVVAQMVSIALFLSLRPPRPDFNGLSDIAEALSGASAAREPRDRTLHVRTVAGPPPRGPELLEDRGFTAGLAAELKVPPAQVRLYFEPDQRSAPRPVRIRRGEPIFFSGVVAAVATPRGWRVVETPPRPMIGAWQRRNILWFCLTAVLLLPFVWFFARRLTRPIRRLADAVDRMGADPLAPELVEHGSPELRVMAQAVNRMQERLARHVAERTAMIGAIAHDLRTPLARIAFRIEGTPEPIRDKVQGDIDQMRAMIAATIGFVRDGSGPDARVPLALADLLAALVAGEREMGRAVTLTVEAAVTVTANPMSIERLIQNLIDNGLRHAGAVEVRLTRIGEEAVVTVADEGPGLAPDLLTRVFEPFVRGDPSRNPQTGGTGLGLTIARSIAQRHGGRLVLANRDGKGLCACFTMPAA